jgi:hypothetical protein
VKKSVAVLAVLLAVSFASAQPYYPDYAFPTGYQMLQGEKAMWQGIQQMANWWGEKRCKITDTCPQTLTSARWGGDSLACYELSNFSHTDITIRYLGWNNRTDTIPIVVPAGYSTKKTSRIWKIVGSTVTGSTLDSLVTHWQFIKRADY